MNQLPAQRRNLLICVFLALSVAVVYWPVHRYDFTNYDDPTYVIDNPYVQGGLTSRGVAWALTSTYAYNWHPLTWISLMAGRQFFGPQAGGQHLVNVLLHIINSLLLFGVLSRMTRAPWRSGFVAALFALHPLHVESVAWVTERKDVLSTTFWMLTLWAYVRYVEEFAAQSSRSRKFYRLALLFFILGLMSKPMLVTLPFVLLLLDYWPLGRTPWYQPANCSSCSRGVSRGEVVAENVSPRPKLTRRLQVLSGPLRRLVLEKLPFLALALVSCVVTVFVQWGGVSSLQKLPWASRLANAAVSYVRYLGKTVWPEGLSIFYPYQAWPVLVVIGAGLFVAGISLLALWRWRRSPHFLVGWLWYLGTLMPVIGLVQVGDQSMADRYAYVPLIGLFVMLAWAIPDVVFKQRAWTRIVSGATAVVLLGISAVVCRAQVRYWQNSQTLFRHALAVTQGNWLAHNNLGKSLLDAGQTPEAIEHFQQAVRIKPDYAVAHDNLGSAFAQTGRLEEAIQQFALALQYQSGLADAQFNMARALARLGKLPEAVDHYEATLRLNPQDAQAHAELGNALLALNRLTEAAQQWEKALEVNPDFAEPRNNLAVALAQAGRLPEAVLQFRQVVEITPTDAEARFNLANALVGIGNVQEAMLEYQHALQIRPGYVDAQNNLARLLTSLPPANGGNPTQALTLAEAICNSKSNQVAPYLETLAEAYASCGRFDDAIATAQQALDSAHSQYPQLVERLEKLLEMYRGERRYRELKAAGQNQRATPHP